MAELLLEFLSEEIPAGMQERAAADLKRLVTKGLEESGLSFDVARAFSGSRRLTLVVDGLPKTQPDRIEERRGPRADAPEKAIAGFLKSVGLNRDQVEERETAKGVVLFAVMKSHGRPTADVLAEFLNEVVGQFPWPKSMRWGTLAYPRWIRPIKQVLGIFDGRVLSGMILAGAQVAYSGGKFPSIQPPDNFPYRASTAGHRFHAPEPFAVTGFAGYEKRLRSAHVVLDAAERRDIIRAAAKKLAAAEGLNVVEDEALVVENAGLVEWPVVLMGRFDEAFLELPPEALRASMRTHQKYFSLRDAAGDLAPRFIVVANIEAEDGGAAIIAGNERVLRARLADAKYFWDLDRRRTLASRIDDLVGIIYHDKLGTLGDKIGRIEGLVTGLLAQVVSNAKRITGSRVDEFLANTERAARLAKADLTTQMVAEFPELQGVMGRYYALADGEHIEVAAAIAEHYAPQGPADACPSTAVSVAVALADKIDTLICFFAIDEKPTGSKDPFALRRTALGLIRLILENELRIPLRDLIRELQLSLEGQGIVVVFDVREVLEEKGMEYPGGDYLAQTVLNFLADRLKVYLREKGVRHDLISAVFALTGEDDLVRLMARVEALRAFLGGEDGANLLTAYKRAANIVRIEEKRDGITYDGKVNQKLLKQDEERKLFDEIHKAEQPIRNSLTMERFVDTMGFLAGLRPSVDAFFDGVTVNCEEPEIRANRLHLLSQIRKIMNTVADFSQIEG